MGFYITVLGVDIVKYYVRHSSRQKCDNLGKNVFSYVEYGKIKMLSVRPTETQK